VDSASTRQPVSSITTIDEPFKCSMILFWVGTRSVPVVWAPEHNAPAATGTPK
jgi:hypothetical protein